ncbi:hypothetical protein B296_00012522 [Ensete ventricosum]|uniref:Protein kinase domain-containing protein n=1 Tax=Ensete ventricosum TaxID=4639 RepID=A0A426Z8E5_ENSVE|nr:hypothetical protein B296_00012522 [Ensete ventricosum]
MGNCGTREENAVVAAHAQGDSFRYRFPQNSLLLLLSHLNLDWDFQQLQMFQIPVKNAPPERKHTRTLSDISDPSTPRCIEDSRNIAIYTDVIAFTLFELETITKSFRADYVLGEGGFGTVYKGYIDENVRVGLKSLPVAVKVLDKDGHQGHREWLLIGYCCEDDHRLLVYEFMFRGSLENHLFRTKLSDFGLAKAGPEGDETHVSTRVMGTYGYAAPEYVMTGPASRRHLTARSDVYSFGVVLLELLTGRRSVDKTRPSKEQSLVDWARPKLNDKRKLLQVLDPRLEDQYSVRAAQKACSLAYYCLSHNPKARPLMSDVVETLQPLQASSGSESSFQALGSSVLPDRRVHRRLAGSSISCKPTPNAQCSPGALPACRVK